MKEARKLDSLEEMMVASKLLREHSKGVIEMIVAMYIADFGTPELHKVTAQTIPELAVMRGAHAALHRAISRG